MSAPQLLTKFFKGWRGLDKQSSHLARSPFAAISTLNLMLTPSNAWMTRPGGKLFAPAAGVAGFHTYNYKDVNGVSQQELLTVDADGLKRATFGTFTITGPANAWHYTMLPEAGTPNAFVFRLFSSTGTPLLVTNLGTGEETSPVTLANLVTAINAVATFSAATSIAALNTAPAAILPLNDGTVANSGTTIVSSVPYWTLINYPSSFHPPFDDASFYSSIDPDYENVCFEDMLNSCFMVHKRTSSLGGLTIGGFKGLLKYDGQNVYYAGALKLPTPPTITPVGGAGNVDIGKHYYYTQIEQKDNRGIVTNGRLSDASTITIAGAATNVTVALVQGTGQMVAFASGFNVGFAMANNGGSATTAAVAGLNTVVVDDGAGGAHSLHAGDVAYFFNRHGTVSAYREYKISSVTATTLVLITAESITLNNDDIISNNLKINVWRTKAGGSKRYLVAALPNQPSNFNLSLVDNLSDANLGICYEDVYPETALQNRFHDVAPFKNATALWIHQGCLCAAGCTDTPETLYYSTPDSPEYWAVATNNTNIGSGVPGPITGGITDSDDTMYVFKENAIYALQGDLDTANYVPIPKSEGDLGISAHQSLVRFGNGYTMGIGMWGPVVLKGGEIISPLVGEDENGVNSRVTRPFLDNQYETDPTKIFRLRRTQTVNDYFNKNIIIHVTCETPLVGGVDRHPNSNSITLVYNYQKDLWHDWQIDTDNNPCSGFAIFQNSLYWCSKYVTTGALTGHVIKVHKAACPNSPQYDYDDNTASITSDLWMTWDDAGEPDLQKAWNKVNCFFIDDFQRTRFVPFTLRVRDYFNYDDTIALTDYPIPVLSSTIREGDAPLIPEATKRHSIRFTTTGLHQRLLLSGYEYEMGVVTQKTRIQT